MRALGSDASFKPWCRIIFTMAIAKYIFDTSNTGVNIISDFSANSSSEFLPEGLHKNELTSSSGFFFHFWIGSTLSTVQWHYWLKTCFTHFPAGCKEICSNCLSSFCISKIIIGFSIECSTQAPCLVQLIGTYCNWYYIHPNFYFLKDSR